MVMIGYSDSAGVVRRAQYQARDALIKTLMKNWHRNTFLYERGDLLARGGARNGCFRQPRAV